MINSNKQGNLKFFSITWHLKSKQMGNATNYINLILKFKYINI